MTFGKVVKFNVLQTSRTIHNLSNDVFISNIIINNENAALLEEILIILIVKNIDLIKSYHNFPYTLARQIGRASCQSVNFQE